MVGAVRSVLVVDDDDTSAELVRQKVERLGVVRVERVRGVDAALDMLHEAFDLVLFEVDLENTTKLMRKAALAGPTTLIAMSDRATRRQVWQTLRAGAHGFLEKPLDVERLCGKLIEIEQLVSRGLAELGESYFEKGMTEEEAARAFQKQTVEIMLECADGDRRRAARRLGLTDVEMRELFAEFGWN